MFDAPLTRLGNWITRVRGVRVPAGRLLLLVPHCLQWSECPHNVAGSIAHCRRCGRCRIGALLELAGRLGVQAYCASGGRQAAARVAQEDVEAVVAVACEKELREGMFAVFPKPVRGVVNLRPHGPCKDTDCDLAEVEAALRELIAAAAAPPADTRMKG